MSNKDLLKQAIAEAKTIREAAIANAKEALEESLTPHLKDMLAAKLQEMEEADDMEEIVNEEDMINDPKSISAHGNVAEAEEEEADEVEGEAENEEEAEVEAEEEELDLEDMSIEEFKDLVRDIVAQEVGQEEAEEEEVPGAEAEDMVGIEDEEEIDINEILAELAEAEEEDLDEMGGGKADPMSMFGKETGKELDVQLVNWIKKNMNSPKVKDLIGKAKAEFQGAANAAGSAMRNEEAELEEIGGGSVDPMSMFGKETGKELDVQLMNWLKKNINTPKVKDLIGKAKAEFQGAANAAGSAMRNEEAEEMEEAMKTIAELKSQLQEVNLLNAKLLYVNKVFKATNLSESQKVNVVAAFDKAETVKEVKLVFETVSKNVVAKPATIREHKSFASKSAGTAATGGKKEVISEVSEQVRRMQKLAGII